MLRIVVLLVGLTLTVSTTSELSSVHQEDREAADVRNSSKWWASVGERVFFAPPMSMMELGQGQGSGSSYYYSLGSSKALTREMEQHRVGGQGLVHIFHLPEGPSALPLQSSGGRRASFSALVQLQRGDSVMADPYPTYTPDVPDDSAFAGIQERLTEASITRERYTEFLYQVVRIGDGKTETRSSSNPEAVKNTNNVILAKFKELGVTACLQTDSDKKVTNVVAFFPGSDPTGGTFTIGAHDDSRPFEGLAPGANDNGSGVAALMALLEAFIKMKVRPKMNVFFVAFGGEEPGLIGSSHFAKSLLRPNDEHDGICHPEGSSFLKTQRPYVFSVKPEDHFAIILDETGWVSQKYRENPVVVIECYDKPVSHGTMRNLYYSNMANSDDPLSVQFNAHPYGSDHMSWFSQGMSAVLVINGDDGQYGSYHSSKDTIEGNIDFDYATKVTMMVFGAVMRCVGIDAPAATAIPHFR